MGDIELCERHDAGFGKVGDVDGLGESCLYYIEPVRMDIL